MKKVFIMFIGAISFLSIGCMKKDADVIKKLSYNINSMTSYNILGELEIINNEDIYKYDVDSSYKESDMFRVSLKNISNNHIQILLKNNDGVYVLTPALNKSFKFQSDWPYNNSQIYLLQTILKDIESDSAASVKSADDYYIITSKVNYSNNDNLVKQNVYLDNNYNIKKVEVLDSDDNLAMRMNFKTINTSPNFSDDYFELDNSINTAYIEEITTSKIDSVIYPMYIPDKTYLETQDKISTNDGERVILTFDGENPFMLIEETSKKEDSLKLVDVVGSPEVIGGTIGILGDKSVSWSSDGIDYYVTSASLTSEELISVANSVSTMPVGK